MSLHAHSQQIVLSRTADPYSRLRVPVYRKMFEAAFFMSLLFLYYSVLVERRQDAIGNFEAMMDIWIVAFAYDELSGFVDAGVLFYQMDFWSLWNLGIIGVGLTFIITSEDEFPHHHHHPTIQLHMTHISFCLHEGARLNSKG